MDAPLTHQELESRLASLNRRMERLDPGPEERFRICMETLRDGFAILSSIRAPSGEIEDFRFDDINEAGCRLNRRSREETLGRRLSEILPGTMGDLFAAYRQVVETGEPMVRETLANENLFGTGRRLNRTVDLRAVKLGDGVAIAWRDATEPSQEGRPPRDHVSLFRTIFEHNPEAILLTSMEGLILAANAAACHLTGRSETELRAGGREGMVDTSDARTQAFLAERRRAGQARGELTLKRKNGTCFPAEVSSTLFTDPGGHQLTVILFRDLSEKKRLESRSRRLAALVESTADAIYALDIEGTITDWNEGATSLFGFAATEAIGNSITLIFPEERQPEISVFLQALRRGDRLRNVETLRRRKDGIFVHVSVTASPIVLPDGTLSGISIIARNITDQVEAASERERMIQELQSALADIQTLQGLIPICSWCKRIRDDQGYWTQVEHYLQEHSQAQFTHGICPECATAFHPEIPMSTSPPRDPQAE